MIYLRFISIYSDLFKNVFLFIEIYCDLFNTSGSFQYSSKVISSKYIIFWSVAKDSSCSTNQANLATQPAQYFRFSGHITIVFILSMGAITTKLEQQTSTLIQPLISHTSDSTCSVKECEEIHQIIDCVLHYESLDINDEDDKSKMMYFFKNIYKSTLDDYIHIITKHADDLEEIFHLIISEFNTECCDLIGCSMLRRHHRDRTKDEEMKQMDDYDNYDDQFLFYRDVMDQIHCYLYHLYDIGYRIKRDQIRFDNHDEKETDDKADTFDAEFSKIKQII